jgi:hypothetical protein
MHFEYPVLLIITGAQLLLISDTAECLPYYDPNLHRPPYLPPCPLNCLPLQMAISQWDL